MSRRDLIIVAVLTNIGLLAVLFMMASNSEEGSHNEKLLVEDAAVSMAKPIEIKMEEKVFLAQESDVDEVDNLLKVFATSGVQESSVEVDEPQSHVSEPITLSDDMVAVTVKKGDVLSKIAAANGTTVSQIKKLNNLTSDQLKVGQTLKIPKGSVVAKKTLLENPIEALKGKFHVIETGDNPWKIAKKFSISVEELLKMNDMDEKKAKNLKPGQKIRVG